MPTYQTAPMFPVIWADQAYAMNKHGIGKMKPVPLSSLQEMGVQSSPHSEWKRQADELVHDRLKNNKLKEGGMLGKRDTTERSQRYERSASRSAIANGVFPGAEYVTSAGLRGGVITSPEGREWLRKRLHNRIVEYDAIAKGDFSAGPPPAINLQTKFTLLDSIFQQVFDQFSTGVFSSGLIDTMSKLLNAYLDAGSTFDSNQLGPYAESIQKLTEAIRSYEGDVGMAGLYGDRALALENQRVILFARKTLANMTKITEEIARTIYMTIPQRKNIMEELRSKFLKVTAREFRPRFGSPSVQRNIGAVPGVELGAESQAPLVPREPPITAQQEAEEDEGFGDFQGAPDFDAAAAGPAPSGMGRYRSRFQQHNIMDDFLAKMFVAGLIILNSLMKINKMPLKVNGHQTI